VTYLTCSIAEGDRDYYVSLVPVFDMKEMRVLKIFLFRLGIFSIPCVSTRPTATPPG